MFDSKHIKKDFPILEREIDGKPLVYLDSAATSQKPRIVIETMVDYYYHHNANVHRGVHTLSDESTQAFEAAHQRIAQFFGAQTEELILTRNTTEALNGVAYGWADAHLENGDVILLSLLEHHSNLVVWQQVCQRRGCRLEYMGLTADGQIDLTAVRQQIKNLGPRLKLIAITHISNTLGTVMPVAEIAQTVHELFPRSEQQPRIVVDGAQSAPHIPLNFHQLGVDFLAFSGHKMLGPMGIGGLLVRSELIHSGEMQPWLFGGGMIKEVYQGKTEFHDNLVDRFVAGTPDVASAVGLAAACDYLDNLDMTAVKKHDQALINYAWEKLSKIPEVELVGPAPEERIGSIAFIYREVHAHDVAQVLDHQGVAVRSGHHCTMPLHLYFNWQATVRASFQVYSTREDIDRLVAALAEVKKIFK